MGSWVKDICHLLIFSTFWYFLIIVWYWLDAANGTV